MTRVKQCSRQEPIL